MKPTLSDELFQDRLRKSHNIQRLRACEVNEFAQLSRFTMLVIAEQRRRDLFHPVYGISGRMDTSGLSAARASGRNNFVSGVAVSIQILLHMGNDLIALAHLDAAPRRQLQILNEREVMETRSGYRTAVDLHRVKDGYGTVPRKTKKPAAAGFHGTAILLTKTYKPDNVRRWIAPHTDH